MLLKQDKVEAESTVKGRLDFITKEMYVHHKCFSSSRLYLLTLNSERHEGLIRDAQSKLEKKKGDIIQIQTSAQAAAAQAQKA